MSTKFYNLKQEISNSPQIDEAVSEKGIKEYVDKTGLQLINPTVTAGSSSSPYLAAKWDVSDVAGVTTVTDGMRVLARVNAVGVSTGGLLLSIDGGTTYHPVVYAASTIPTTTYMAVGTTVLLIYNADATATCYGTSGTSTSYTGCWQLDYHFTLYMYRLVHNNGTYITKTDLKRYKLMVQYDETTMLPISSGSSTSGHTIDTTNAFMPFGQICYCNTSTTNYKSAGAAIGASVLANMYAFDLRYTFNGGTTMLTANKDVYLVANPQSDGKAKIDSSPLAQELPSTEDNKIYIYLGHTYSAYQIELHPVHPIYWYKNGAIRMWDNADLTDADIKVKQDKDVTTNGALPLLMSPKPLDSSFTTQTETSSLVPNIYVNPSTETLYAPRFSGNGANLTGVPVGSHSHGNIANGGTLTDTAAAPVNGDYIVIRDASNSKIQTSNIAFDGSSQNKYLSQKGTWENVPTCSLVTTTGVNSGVYTVNVPGFRDSLTNYRFALVLKQAPGIQGNIKVNINNLGDKYVYYYNADGQSVSLLGGNVLQVGDVLDLTYSSNGLMLVGIKRGGTNVLPGSVTSVQVQGTSPVQSSQSTAQTGTLNTTISLASAYGDTQNPYGSKTANTVLAAPNGSAGTPSFRALVPADLPDVTVTMSLTRVVATKSYTVSNASHTPAQVNTLMTSGARVVIKAEISGGYFYLYPDLEYSSMLLYFWGAGTDSSIVIIGNLTGTAFDNIPANGWGGGYDFYTYLRASRAITSGDHIAITSVDAISDIEQSSIVFDTSNTTQYLRADGTWATPAGGGGDTGYTSSSLSNNTSTITFGNTKEYKRVVVTGSTQTFNLSVGNNCTNYLLVTNSGSGDCVIALGVQSGTNITSVVKPSSGITIPTGKAIELSFIKIADAATLGEYTLVVTVSAEMEIDTLS